MTKIRTLALAAAIALASFAGGWQAQPLAQSTYTQIVPYTTPTGIGKLGGIYYGAGTPNGNLTAPKGSLYVNSSGSSSSTRLYVNTDGSTTWVAVTTAS